MSGNDLVDEAPTRRDVITFGSIIAVGGGLAGCLGNGSGADADNAADSDDTPTADTAYEACIEPAGCRTYEAVPETWLVYNGGWADMAFALGQRDGFITAGNMIPAFFFEPFDLEVPPAEELPPLRAEGKGWDKELFFEYDPDVILMDPEFMHGTGWYDNWDEADTREIQNQVAPFFGNNCRRRREFHDHKLYSLYGAFERLAALFQAEERYEAFADLHEEVQTAIHERLPSRSERPEVGLINGGSDPNAGQFYPLNTDDEGYEMKPYRDLDVSPAFSAETLEEGEADYERMLEADPEIIIVHWGIGTTGDTNSFSAAAFREQYVAPMEEDSVGQELTAVQEGNVYPGAYGEQGPIVNLLQTEMKAQQLYPEEFGEFDAEAFPEVPEENRLFDRQRVRDIINGDI